MGMVPKPKELFHATEDQPRGDQQASRLSGGEGAPRPEVIESGKVGSSIGPDSAPEPEQEAQVTAPAVSGPYPEPPAQMQLEEIRCIIRETAQPELVPTVSWTKPAKAIEHRLIHPKLSVDRRRRPDGAMVPCSLCSGENPKCLSFYLLWSADGHLRVVGHVCGPKYFGEHTFREMERAASREAAKLANETFLLDHLRDMHRWLADLAALSPVCEHAQKLKRSFMSGVPSLHGELCRMVRGHDGALVILRRRERAAEGPAGFRSSLGGQESEYNAVPVAHLRGHTFLAASYNPVSKLSKIRQSLRGVLGNRRPMLSEEDVLSIVCELDEAALDRTAKAIREVHRNALRLSEKLHDMSAFFTDDNLASLDRWGSHDENAFKFTIERGRQSVSFRVSWQERVTLSVNGGIQPPVLQHLGRLG